MKCTVSNSKSSIYIHFTSHHLQTLSNVHLMKSQWWMHLHKYANIEKHLTANEQFFCTLPILKVCERKKKNKINGWCYCLSTFRGCEMVWARLFISHNFYFLHRVCSNWNMRIHMSSVETKNLCSIKMNKCNSLKMVLLIIIVISFVLFFQNRTEEQGNKCVPERHLKVILVNLNSNKKSLK